MDLVAEVKKQEVEVSEKRGAALERLRDVLRKGDKATKPDIDAARVAAGDLGLSSDRLELLRLMIQEGERLCGELESVPGMREEMGAILTEVGAKTAEAGRLMAAAQELDRRRRDIANRVSFIEVNAPCELRALHRASAGIVPLPHGVGADGSEDLPRVLGHDGEFSRIYRKIFGIGPEEGIHGFTSGRMKPVITEA